MPDDGSFGALALRASALSVFSDLRGDGTFISLEGLLPALDQGNAAAVSGYAMLLRYLLGGDGGTGGPKGLRDALIEALLRDENALSEWAAREAAPPPPELAAAVADDLRTLQALAACESRLQSGVERLAGFGRPPLPASTRTDGIYGAFAQSDDWGALVDALTELYREHGSGTLAEHLAFRWDNRISDPWARLNFSPVLEPDIVDPGSLVGYEEERELLRKNTEQFVKGFTANNVLLYGDRGTGKSSSVKSMLWYVKQGESPWRKLRMIEVPKARLGDFPSIVAQLRGRPQRFILFVDDLSFEEGETQYKDMKAMLEGGLEARAENVVVYATSNRRHLIREQFSDRTAPDSQEVHARDTVQEKLSFADRFGMTITFPTPDQSAYLAIVEGLAKQRGLPIQPAALRARAIEWAAWHNGRSGRTARQLVDQLEGELGLTRDA